MSPATRYAVPVPSERPIPEIVTLCGSSRFEDELAAERLRLSLEGHLVLGLSGVPREAVDADPVLRDHLDWLHRRRIVACHRVHVVDPGGYVGPTTAREVAFARSLGRPVTYMVASADPVSPGPAADGTAVPEVCYCGHEAVEHTVPTAWGENTCRLCNCPQSYVPASKVGTGAPAAGA